MNHRLLLLFALSPLTVLAQEGFGSLRYDYVSANLVVTEIDEFGFELEGSTAVTEDLVVFGRFFDFEQGNGIERELLEIGVGHVWNIRPSIDFIGSIAYGDNSVSTPGLGKEDEEGLLVGAQVRGWATARVELNGGVTLDNSAGSSTDTVLELGMQFFHAANWSYGGRIRSDDEDTAVFAGIRFYFGASRAAGQ